MKIRIKGNSVRVRLSRTEVEAFAKEGRLEERTEFGANDFIYALQTQEGIDNLTADFSGNQMTMYVPAHLPGPWVANDTIGYENNMEIAGGKHLFLLLEKDFQCVDAPTYEDQSDNYVNPNKVC